MLNASNLLAPSRQIWMLPTQLPRVFSLRCSFFFYVILSCYPELLHPIFSLTRFSSVFSLHLCHSPLSSPFSIFVSRFLAVPPQPPVILGLEREDVKAGRILVLECVSHGGNPLASLHWTKVNPQHHLLRRLCETLSHRQKELFY